MAVLSFSRTSLITSDLDRTTKNPAALDTGDCVTVDTSREGTDVVGDLEHQQRTREEGEWCNRRYRLLPVELSVVHVIQWQNASKSNTVIVLVVMCGNIY